jgi:hypothetical protein
VPDTGSVWVRHFDPEAWPYGLSDRWTIVDLEDRQTSVAEISGLGVVLDMKLIGKEFRILSSSFIGPGEFEIIITTLDATNAPPPGDLQGRAAEGMLVRR